MGKPGAWPSAASSSRAAQDLKPGLQNAKAQVLEQRAHCPDKVTVGSYSATGEGDRAGVSNQEGRSQSQLTLRPLEGAQYSVFRAPSLRDSGCRVCVGPRCLALWHCPSGGC